MVDAVDELAENIHLLGELGILPEAVFGVVFEDQRDAAVLGMGQAGLDRFGRERHALVDRQLRPPLAGEHAAVGAAQRVRHVDPAYLLGDLPGPEGRVGMREVGKAAHHRDWWG